MLATPPAPQKTDTPAAAAAAATESGGDLMDEEVTEAAAGAAAQEDTPAAGGDDSADKDGKQAEMTADDGKEPEANGNGADDGKTATTTEMEKEKEGAVVEADAKKAEGQDVSNGKASHVSPERKKREEEDKKRTDDVDVYRRDMGWLRSANGMVAEVRRSFSLHYQYLFVLSAG